MFDIYSDPDTGLVIGQTEYGDVRARQQFAGALRTPWPGLDLIEMREGEEPLEPDMIPEPALPYLREASLDEWRTAVGALIEELYAMAIRAITQGASQEDVDTWTLKKQMAEDFNSSDSARRSAAVADLAGMVSDMEAQAQGLSSDEDKAAYMASRILAKAALYRQAVTVVERSRRDAWAASAALATPDDARAFMGVIEQAAQERLDAFLAQVEGAS